jgi:hypothetical protein
MHHKNVCFVSKPMPEVAVKRLTDAITESAC